MVTGMKKYKVEKYKNFVKEVDVVRETDKFVVLDKSVYSRERKVAKVSEWERYLDTEEAAIIYLKNRLETRLEQILEERIKIEDALSEINAGRGVKYVS